MAMDNEHDDRCDAAWLLHREAGTARCQNTCFCDGFRAGWGAAERSKREQLLVVAVTLWFDWIDDGVHDRITGKAWSAIGEMRRAVTPYWKDEWAEERAQGARARGTG